MPSKNQKYLNQVAKYTKQLEELAGLEVVIGIPKSNNAIHKGSKFTVAQIGAVHEYGSPENGIPQRSFLRVPLSNNSNELFKQISKDLKFSKINSNTALGRLGSSGVSVVLEAFNSQGGGTWKELKPSTEARRKKGKGSGSNKPLIDTGQLRQKITFEVRGVK